MTEALFPPGTIRPGTPIVGTAGRGTVGQILTDEHPGTGAPRSFAVTAGHVFNAREPLPPGVILDDVEDLAFVLLPEDCRSSSVVLGTGHSAVTYRDPQVGDEVFKVGSRSGITHGVVTTLRAGKAFVEPGPVWQEISSPGDSGASWISTASGAVLGIHTLGERDPDPAKEIAGMIISSKVAEAFARCFPHRDSVEMVSVPRAELERILDTVERFLR